VTEPVNNPRFLRLPLILLFVALLLSMAVVYHPSTGWNVNTRLNLVFAVVDRGTIHIDAFHETPPYDTGDKALFDGHFYSDKIFGVSLLALPFYWAAQLISGGALDFVAGHYLMKSAAVAIPGAAAGVLFLLILIRAGAPPRRALLATAFSVFGTMWF
jgi:hypothetical protein